MKCNGITMIGTKYRVNESPRKRSSLSYPFPFDGWFLLNHVLR